MHSITSVVPANIQSLMLFLQSTARTVAVSAYSLAVEECLFHDVKYWLVPSSDATGKFSWHIYSALFSHAFAKHVHTVIDFYQAFKKKLYTS